MWIDKTVIDGGNPLCVAAYLTDIEEADGERRGHRISGRLGNYKVVIKESGMFLTGSLAGYYLPSNAYTLTRATIQQAIEKMSDELHIDVSTAKINRIDVSTVIQTKRPPSDYFSVLGEKRYFKRLLTAPTSLYYNTQERQLVFYDKTKEAKAKGAMIPPIFNGCNLMRYEMRILKRVSNYFKQEVTAATTYKPDFYYMLVQEWRQGFETIKKLNIATVMADEIKTVKDGGRAALSMLLQQQQDGQAFIKNFIADLKAKNVYADPKYYTRLKNLLTEALQGSRMQSTDLAKELEEAVKNIANYAR